MNPDGLDLERLAELIAERLDERHTTRSRWVSADVVAVHLGVEPGYVYEHAAELGARRLGTGPKARLRFRLDLVDAALCDGSRASPPQQPARLSRTRRDGRRPLGTRAPLLPIRGVES